MLLLLPYYLLVATFGISYIFLRNSKLAPAALFVPTAIGIPFLVVALSIFGYQHALQVPYVMFCAAVVAGPLITAFVVAIFAKDIWSSLRLHAPPILVCHLLSLVGYALPLSPHLINQDFGYFEFMNGEYLSYARFANVVLQKGYSSILTPYVEYSSVNRDGVDFLNVVVSLVLSKSPVNIVQITSAALRYGMISLIFYVLLEIVRDKHRKILWSAAFCALLVLNPLDVYHYMSSFMAANLALMPAIAFILLLFVGETIDRWRLLVLAVIKDLFLLVSYPELLPFVKIFEFIVCCGAYFRGNKFLFNTLLLSNLIVLAVNPMLVFAKIKFLYNLLGASAGVDIFGLPQTTPLSFFRRIIGYEFPWLSSTGIFGGIAVIWMFILNAIFMVVVLSWFGCNRSGVAVITFPVFLMYFTLKPVYLFSIGEATNFYGLVKIIFIFLPFIPLMIAVYFSQTNSWSFAQRALICIPFLNIILYTLVIIQTTIAFSTIPNFYPASFSEKVVLSAGQNSSVSIASENTAAFLYWANILTYANININFRSEAQLRAFNPFVTEYALGKSPMLSNNIVIAPLQCQWYDAKYDINVSSSNCGPIPFDYMMPSRAFLEGPNVKLFYMSAD